MRAFLAIIIPEPPRVDLDAHLEPRRESEADGIWRWSIPETWHLTLAFMADLPDHLEEPLVDDLPSRLAGIPPLRLRIQGAGGFPDPIAARVLWMGVAGEGVHASLAQMSRRLRDCASHLGARVDGQRLHPHVTVARRAGGRGTRTRGGVTGPPGGRLVQALDAYRGPEFDVDRVTLVRSHLGEGRAGSSAPRYEHLAEIPLRG